MGWWGTLIGGAVGFMLGGPLGALLGASLGQHFGQGAARRSGTQYLPGDQERVQAAFFAATFAVMGHIAKADGRVTGKEISLAETLMRQMDLDDRQRRIARRLFNEGKQPDFVLDDVLQQFRNECHRRTNLLRVFLEIQVQAALIDGTLDPNEHHVLMDITRDLGFGDHELRRIIDGFAASRSGGESSRADAPDPYKVLGVAPGTPLPEIRKAYRRLLSQHHPDKLVSKGLPDEMIRLANRRTHEIREAWQELKARHQPG